MTLRMQQFLIFHAVQPSLGENENKPKFFRSVDYLKILVLIDRRAFIHARETMKGIGMLVVVSNQTQLGTSEPLVENQYSATQHSRTVCFSTQSESRVIVIFFQI